VEVLKFEPRAKNVKSKINETRIILPNKYQHPTSPPPTSASISRLSFRIVGAFDFGTGVS
jgi:hypothetical protein